MKLIPLILKINIHFIDINMNSLLMVKINPYICDMELKPINKSYGGYISIDNLYEFISINYIFKLYQKRGFLF